MNSSPNNTLLRKYLSQIECTVSIPNFTKARPYLYELFAHENGLASTIIRHYYFTGINTTTTKILNDPAEQARWCIGNLPYCSHLVKRCRQVRNKLVHNDVLTYTLLRDAITSVLEMGEKCSQVKYLINSMVDELCNICEIILCLEEFTSNCCSLCGRTILTSLSIPSNDETIKIPDEPVSFKYLKENGWQEELKGRKIVFSDGKFQGMKAIFKSWSGTSVYIDVEGVGRKQANITSLVILSETDQEFKTPCSLGALKHSEFSDKIKEMNLIILDGKFKDHEFKFIRWNGRVANVILHTGEEKSISLDRLIDIKI